MKAGNKKSMGATLKRLIAYVLKQYKWQCLLVALCILVSTAANIGGTLFMRNLIDDYILPFVNQARPDLAPLLRALLVMAVVYYTGVFCTWAYNFIMIYVSQGMLKTVRDDLFGHMERLPVRYFDTKSHGDIMSIYTNDTDTLRQVISQSMPQMLSAVITIVGVFVSMLILSPPLTLITVAMVICMVFATRSISSKSGYYFVKQQTDVGNLNGYIEEMMEGQKVVKVFCHEEACVQDFKELNGKLRDSANNANRYASILAIAGAERIFGLLDEEPEQDGGYVKLVNARYDARGNLTEVPERTGIWAWKHYHKADDTTTYQLMEGDVVFDHVDFGYTEDKEILHDIEIFARPGQKVAFVGATGAGKTTITNLINRFYDVQDGKIRYDGININKIKKDDLRHSLGLVLQDTHLFTGTVMDNIRYGKLDATEEEVVRAAKLANAHDFIMRLPDGYRTQLKGSGSSLSQGQRQLLAIARVAVADPPVLILDEATSSIDTRTEKIVQDGMDRLMKGRTVFVIAHRLSTIKNSDVIMVLDHGRILERGNHESLLAKKGMYYQLYTGKLEQE